MLEPYRMRGNSHVRFLDGVGTPNLTVGLCHAQ